MTSDNQLRNEWRSYKCSPEIFETVTIRGRNLQVAPPTIESWKALSEVMAAHQYEVRKSDTGSYNCRNISGTNTPSLHSYGIAVDVNWNTNPLKRTSDRRPVRYSHAQTQAARGDDVRGGRADTDMTPQMIADILAIKTKDGDRVFDWGGSWETIKDAMHFELDIGPSKLASGIDWSTVKGGADAAAGGVGSGTATDGAPASEDNANLKAYTVSSRDGLRLRAGSGTEFEVRAVMPYGTVIYELRREGKWSIIDRTGDGIADGSANNSFLTRTPDSDQPATGTLVAVGGGSQGSETASDFLFLNSNYTATICRRIRRWQSTWTLTTSRTRDGRSRSLRVAALLLRRRRSNPRLQLANLRLTGMATAASLQSDWVGHGMMARRVT